MSDIVSKAKLALVVDDSVMQCKVLSVLLKEEGYHVFAANDGAQGVEMYVNYQPDLVLMDINMPVMDGYEAARRIKALSQKNSLCPLIFITSMDSDQAYIDSIEAGGDGILVRPFSPEVFKAKIKSIQRISDLYLKLKALQQEQQKDAELAEQLMSGVIEARNFAREKISIVKKAAALFSGDIQLTAACPNGDVNIMLGDFTGHGLRSSIGAIPLAETFRTMTRKGFTLYEIINQINQQLYQLLPADLFLAATFVTVSCHEHLVYVFNAGLPDTYVFKKDGDIRHKISSNHPPIGVLPTLIEDVGLTVLPISDTDRVVLISDGIVEAHNEQGEMFGFERFEKAAQRGVLAKSITKDVINEVEHFCQNVPQEDDISIIDIPCVGWNKIFVASASPNIDQQHNASMSNEAAWQWQLVLTGSRLAHVNPIPMAMNQIQDIEGNAEHWQSLFTILTELFVNALDHGVLGLDSKMKSSAKGFAEYFQEREKRLKALQHGFVEINLRYFPLASGGGRVIIHLVDSGSGFDIDQFSDVISQNHMIGVAQEMQLSGRGIKLVSQLCESLHYMDQGRQVQASYVWN